MNCLGVRGEQRGNRYSAPCCIDIFSIGTEALSSVLLSQHTRGKPSCRGKLLLRCGRGVRYQWDGETEGAALPGAGAIGKD